jgi:hypothetical protein
LGAECPLPVNNPVTRTVGGEAVVNDQVVNLLRFSEAFSKLVKDTLKVGGFEAFWEWKLYVGTYRRTQRLQIWGDLEQVAQALLVRR